MYFFLLLLTFSSFLFANLTVKNTPFPGGIAVIEFNNSTTITPKVFFKNRKVLVQQSKNNKWQALVGIPLNTKPGTYFIEVKGLSTQYISFIVKGKNYKKQYITLIKQKEQYVHPLNQHIQRIQKERKILSKTITEFSDKKPHNSFIPPISGKTTSEFGLQRVFNMQPRRPHSGLDFAAKKGTKIVAPMDAKVILVGYFFFNGRAVFLDHGQGLITAYIHLSKIKVKQGDTIKQGEVLGLVGQTGRTTGPHLHWSVYLTSTAINPKLLLNNE